MTNQGKTVVLGVGNTIMSDEGLGVHCALRLEASGRLPAGVIVVDGGTSTAELLGDLEDLALLVIVDAVVTGGAPGSMLRLEGAAIPSAFSNKMSPHQTGINDLLATLQFVDRAPGRVVLLGMMPARLELGMELSPTVEAMLPELTERVLAELRAHAGA